MILLNACKQFVAAGIGTIAFSVMYTVPVRYYLDCGVIGGLGWLIVWYGNGYLGLSTFVATLIATIFVTAAARVEAAYKKSPATMFLMPVIFPLVPGISFYRAIFYLIQRAVTMTEEYGRAALTTAVAIVIGIMCAYEIPQKTVNRIGQMLPEVKRKRKQSGFHEFLERHNL